MKKKIEESGKSFDLIADRIGINRSSFRALIKRGQFIKEKIEPFAKEIGITAEELKRAGVVFPRNKLSVSTTEDILPILKIIVGSEVEKITRPQLEQIIRVQKQFKREMTSALVVELLKCI